jgi:hypothetical protein
MTLLHGGAWVKASQDLLARVAQGWNDFASRIELHCDGTRVIQLRESAVDVAVVQLAGSGLMSSRNICNVNESNQGDVLLELLDQVTVGTLLMVEIVEDADAVGLSTAFTISKASVTPSR